MVSEPSASQPFAPGLCSGDDSAHFSSHCEHATFMGLCRRDETGVAQSGEEEGGCGAECPRPKTRERQRERERERREGYERGKTRVHAWALPDACTSFLFFSQPDSVVIVAVPAGFNDAQAWATLRTVSLSPCISILTSATSATPAVSVSATTQHQHHHQHQQHRQERRCSILHSPPLLT